MAVDKYVMIITSFIIGLCYTDNADIVNLVEIENLEALNTLNAKFLQGRGYKPCFAKGKDSFTGQDRG